METSLNDGVYDNRGNAVQGVSHQPLLMDTNEMYTNNVIQYQTTDSSNSVYEIKETMMKTSEAELTQSTQQYYYSQTDQQNNQGGYGDYVLQQQTETTYIQQQTTTPEFNQEQFLQISNIENEQVVTERPDEVSMQYVEAADNNFGSQYEAEKHQDVANEGDQIVSAPPEDQLQNDVLQEETLETNATVEAATEENNAPVENMVEEVCTEEQAPILTNEHAIDESSTVESQTEYGDPPVLENSETKDKNEAVTESHKMDKQDPEEPQQVVEESVHITNENVPESQVQQDGNQFVQETGSIEIHEEIVDDPAPVEASGGLDPLQVQEADDTSPHDDQSAYMSEIREETNSRLSVTSGQGNRRSTRRTYQDIPLHVVGHNLTKPGENQLNGKPIPKPRLGVKVPYWNLSSQMLSKAEIEKEILERSKVKQDQASSVSFARSLTQRLFKKIADTDKAEGSEEDDVSKTDKGQNEKSDSNSPPENSKIKNDSDLLAILEGDDTEMPVMTKKTTATPQVDEANIKALEREIALQQLEELPLQLPRRHPRRSKTSTSTPQTSSKKNPSSPPSNDLDAKSLSGKENSTSPAKQSSLSAEISPKKEAIIDVEPQVRVNMVLKTYSRKRKADDSIDSTIKEPKKTVVEEPQAKKDDMGTPSQGVYVTKSSRVIKKKIIWDPDEVPSRSPKPSKSVETVPATTPKPATEKPAEKKPSPEKLVKKMIVMKKEKPAATDTKSAITDKKTATPEKKHVVQDKKPVTVTEKKAITKSSSPKVKPKKPMSELDRLLMDEGAVKMLYELKSNDEGTPSPPKKQKNFVSIEKAQKDIMKKASQIKNDLVIGGEGTKTLRKKEAALLQTGIEFQGPSPVTISPVKPGSTSERKMSKDSVRSSIHTPPPSPFMHSHSSMLIRRRSSSSISSSDDLDSDAPRSNKRSRKSKRNTEEFKEMDKDPLALDVNCEIDIDTKTIQGHKLLAVKKNNKQVSVELNYTDTRCLLSEEMLDELTTTVKKYSKDRDCSVLCITSASKAFCLGLDYTSLVVSDDKERKTKAASLADKVRDFLLSLLHFPKVLVAGIQGECAGLAVMMLPLFDTVIANDNASFSTPYVKLGCIPEAGFLLERWGLSGRRLAADLLYTGDKITADDACKRGLVSKLCWPEKYNETLKNVLAAIAKGSKQSLLSTKKELQSHTIKQTESALEKEIKQCADLWTSAECQKNFAEALCNG